VREAKARAVPIRIGVNFGSLPPVGKIGMTRGLSRHRDGVNELPKAGEVAAGEYSVVDHMVETGLWEIGILEDLDFDLIKISLKAFDIDTTVEAYKRMARLVPYPLHLGITEAGTAKSGSVRTAIGLGMLLYEGIGDTIRVSLSDDPREEVFTGFEILKSLELRKAGAVLVACPSCGRADVDVISLANTVDDLLKKTKSSIKVAVMGCEVNGPGEAKDADVGIAAGAGRAIIFRKGRKSRIVDEADMLSALMEEVRIVEAEAGAVVPT
jgi:(E)-4-hydroxy-3-methylbut-2-enyl-diphosphate synthase